MAKKHPLVIACQRVELGGVGYVIIGETVFDELCRRANATVACDEASGAGLSTGLGTDRASLAEKLIGRRRSVGLSQARLARRAGIRPETLNRIERGKTTPDFATVRKLVMAMNEAELEATNPQRPEENK